MLMTVKLAGAVEYHIRLGRPDVAQPEGEDEPLAGGSTGGGQGEGELRLPVPSRGRLLIRMGDGSTREIDLSLVSEVVVIDR